MTNEDLALRLQDSHERVGSDKKLRITVDDSGALTATEVT